MFSDTRTRGIWLMLSSNVAFCAMACLVKYVAYLNVYTTTLFRFLVGLAFIGVLAMSGRVRLAFVNKPALFARGLLGGVAICMGFVSIAKLGIAKASVIVYLYPVFASVFGVLLLGERMTLRSGLAMAGALVGTMLLMVNFSGGAGDLLSGFGIWECVAVGGALLGGLTMVLVKKLQATDTTVAIFFAQCLVGFWIVLVPGSVSSGVVSTNAVAILLAIGVLATLGQLLSTDGYKYLSVATASILVMIAPVMNSAAGVLIFHEVLTRQSVVGSMIVLASTSAAVWKKT